MFRLALTFCSKPYTYSWTTLAISPSFSRMASIVKLKVESGKLVGLAQTSQVEWRHIYKGFFDMNAVRGRIQEIHFSFKVFKDVEVALLLLDALGSATFAFSHNRRLPCHQITLPNGWLNFRTVSLVRKGRLTFYKHFGFEENDYSVVFVKFTLVNVVSISNLYKSVRDLCNKLLMG